MTHTQTRSITTSLRHSHATCTGELPDTPLSGEFTGCSFAGRFDVNQYRSMSKSSQGVTEVSGCIAPGSVPGFVAAQIVGALVGLALIGALYPGISASADDVVVPHHPSAGIADQRRS